MHFTEGERARYEAEQALFKRLHGECHGIRHSVSGSLTTHCGKCCPPPPTSPSQREAIAGLLSRSTPPYELMRWRLRLYCGHVTERRAHYTYKAVEAAFSGSIACPECGLNPATIVDGEAIGLEAARPSAPRSGGARTRPSSRKPTRADLEARVRKLETEVERLRSAGSSGGLLPELLQPERVTTGRKLTEITQKRRLSSNTSSS
jgi:hypothetical protein